MKTVYCRSRTGPVLAVALFAGVLSACSAEDRFAAEHSGTLSVEERYPITVENKPVSLELPVAPGNHRLNGTQRGQVTAFLSAYKSQGQGSVVVRVPSGTRNESAARSAVNDIRLLAAEQGLAAGAVRFQPYRNRGKGAYPPIVMAYNALTAIGPDCGYWPDDVLRNPNNRPFVNYGCASQRNLAAMVADPRDLQGTRALAPGSAERRATVFGKYVKGDKTSAADPNSSGGTVSGVGQ